MTKGTMQLTQAAGMGREYGVFRVDPIWDGELRSMVVEFEMSAYGGGGADGMSFHLSPSGETSEWIDVPNYRVYENMVVGTGVSIQADEMQGFSSLSVNGEEHVRGTYPGGRNLAVSIRWTPELLTVQGPGFDFSLADASTMMLPNKGWVLTFAARTGTATNIHSIDNLYIHRCYRDLHVETLLMDGTCLPNKGSHDFNSTHSVWIPNSTASYHAQVGPAITSITI
jgi:hypothetical protein